MTELVICPECKAEQPMDMRIDSFIFGGFSARCECSKCGYKGMWSGGKWDKEEAKRVAIERATKGVRKK